MCHQIYNNSNGKFVIKKINSTKYLDFYIDIYNLSGIFILITQTLLYGSIFRILRNILSSKLRINISSVQSIIVYGSLFW